MREADFSHNLSLQPTPAIVASSVDAGHLVGPAWLGLGR